MRANSRIFAGTVAARAAAVAATGCGSGDDGRAASSTRSPAMETSANEPPASERRCPGGSAQPITIEEVVAAAADHGITLYDDPTCADPAAVAQAANILQYGPHANRDREDEIMPAQGAVTCFVVADGDAGERSVERVHYEGDVETYFRLANLECVIYPDEEHADEQVGRLEAVLKDLTRQLEN